MLEGARLSVRQKRPNRRGALHVSEVHRALPQDMSAHGHREPLQGDLQESGLPDHTSAHRVQQ